MKRRTFLIAASAAVIVPAAYIGMRGRHSGPSRIPSPTPQSEVGYSTEFTVDQAPLSDGGRWINGRDTGLDWNDVHAAAGAAIGADVVTGYNDDIAVLNTAFASDQFAEGTVHRAQRYSPDAVHEVELLLRFHIAPHTARGYEVLWVHSGELNIVRWNGPLGDYTPLRDVHGPNIGPAQDGDVLRAEIRGSTISVYKNGRWVMEASSGTWTDGQPGVGFFPRPGSTLEDYGWASFRAGELVA